MLQKVLIIIILDDLKLKQKLLLEKILGKKSQKNNL